MSLSSNECEYYFLNDADAVYAAYNELYPYSAYGTVALSTKITNISKVDESRLNEINTILYQKYQILQCRIIKNPYCNETTRIVDTLYNTEYLFEYNKNNLLDKGKIIRIKNGDIANCGFETINKKYANLRFNLFGNNNESLYYIIINNNDILTLCFNHIVMDANSTTQYIANFVKLLNNDDDVDLSYVTLKQSHTHFDTKQYMNNDNNSKSIVNTNSKLMDCYVRNNDEIIKYRKFISQFGGIKQILKTINKKINNNCKENEMFIKFNGNIYNLNKIINYNLAKFYFLKSNYFVRLPYSNNKLFNDLTNISKNQIETLLYFYANDVKSDLIFVNNVNKIELLCQYYKVKIPSFFAYLFISSMIDTQIKISNKNKDKNYQITIGNSVDYRKFYKKENEKRNKIFGNHVIDMCTILNYNYFISNDLIGTKVFWQYISNDNNIEQLNSIKFNKLLTNSYAFPSIISVKDMIQNIKEMQNDDSDHGDNIIIPRIFSCVINYYNQENMNNSDNMEYIAYHNVATAHCCSSNAMSFLFCKINSKWIQNTNKNNDDSNNNSINSMYVNLTYPNYLLSKEMAMEIYQMFVNKMERVVGVNEKIFAKL